MPPHPKEHHATASHGEDPSIAFGRLLAHPEPGDEVVISGVAGHFPEADDVRELRDNLFAKTNAVTDDNNRWKTSHPEVTKMSGKFKDIESFDAGFFGIHPRQATSMDPASRIILERVMECILDAGMNPSDLKGSNTGVFVASCLSESEKTWYYDRSDPQMFGITGSERSMIPNRISYFFQLEGPSFVCDTACSSSIYALEHAYNAIRTGQCDQAIVTGSNICLQPFTFLQYFRLGILCKDGKCKVFDDGANGFVRAEAAIAIFLQKSKDAKRIYTTIAHTKINCDGKKNTGITHPSSEMQSLLFEELYKECGVPPSDLTYLEAHGTGTKVGDIQEAKAIEIFIKDKKEPLLVGSIKSNIGHTEAASGMCGIVKAIIAMEAGYIPPNIHYKSPRKGIKPLEDGRMVVVTEKSRLPDKNALLGINGFGFGGANGHVLLKRNLKEKVANGQSEDKLPRLVCVSGRTREAVHTLLDDVMENKVDIEHVRLIHDIFRKNIVGHQFRGYAILNSSNELARSAESYLANKIPFYIVLSDLTNITLSCLARCTLFNDTLKKIQKILAPKNINIEDIVLNKAKTSSFDNLIGTVVVQICLIDILKNMELEPVDVFGHFYSELVSSYWRNAITLQEAVECAYVICAATQDTSRCTWLLVIATKQRLQANLPKDVDFIASISENASVISGKTKTISNLKEMLQKNGVTSYLLGDVYDFKKEQKNKLSEILSTRKLNGSADYFIDKRNYLSSLSKFLNGIPKKAIVLEIGDGIFQSIAGGMKENLECIITKNFNTLLHGLGRLYEIGYNPQLHKLYPNVEFPVSRGTPSISPKIKWKHDTKWWVPSYGIEENCEIGQRKVTISFSDPSYAYMDGHVIDGRNLFPATGYLEIVWQTLAQTKGLMYSDMHVVFENLQFKRACPIPQEGIELIVTVQRESGYFEVVDGNVPLVTGRVYEADDKEECEASSLTPSEVSEDIEKPMLERDIYKELRLRGYNYKGAFKSLTRSDSKCEVGRLKWDGNWVAFADGMLQFRILREDTRLLYVSTSIKRISINAKKHISYCATFGADQTLPVYGNRDLNIVRSGGIEMRGIVASCIARKKYVSRRVLEKYQFVPNVCKLSLELSVRINMQMALENAYSIKVKIVELIDEATVSGSEPLAPLLREYLENVPLLQPDIIILSQRKMEIPDITIEDRKLLSETDCMLVIGSKLLERQQVLNIAIRSLKEGGFIISREPLNREHLDSPEVDVLTVHEVAREKIVLMRKKTVLKSTTVHISTADTEFEWIPVLRNAVKSHSSVIAYAQHEPCNGILGMINCIRKESGGHMIKCLLINDVAPNFDPEHPFYREQLKKDMAINIFKDGKWGTYRHLPLEDCANVEAEHVYVNTLSTGDLSSLKWIEGPLRRDARLNSEKLLIDVYYSALNFRDLMTATGRIDIGAITKDRREQECVQGLEYSGVTDDGKRIMGIAANGAMTTLLSADPLLTWGVPDSWTLEDAATVPVAYVTALYALYNRGGLKRGDTVLIHSGTGGVGQAAIALALHFDCEVFTTVGTPEKRELIKKMFPQLTDKNIANSHDTSFENHISRETKGRGVDVILNSLSEEKLLASVRCLARGGRFVEIGKYDLNQDNCLNLLLLKKEASFHGFMLDAIFKETEATKLKMRNALNDTIKQGAVRPLQKKVFKMEEVESAFRYMSTGKHTGKILIQIREEQGKISNSRRTTFRGMPKYYCDESKTYIIIGGLGGIGLELVDWLVLRGAKNIIITSRTGIKTGYQQFRVGIWRSYGCTVRIATDNITTKEGCRNLITEANKLGPVHGVFNLAVILNDCIIDNQSKETFNISLAPKAWATRYLDEITRELCPELRDFVMFSSVSCSRGNADQMNYGMANSTVERICEKRRAEGYPALAVEWGPVGDVGLLAEMQKEQGDIKIGGLLLQRISSCLSSFEIFMTQNSGTIFASMVVADKGSTAVASDNIIGAVANILGVKDLRIISLHATLAEIGMDSITALQIKQTLEQGFEVFLTPQDIKSMTFSKLQSMQAERVDQVSAEEKTKTALAGLKMVLRLIGDESTADIPIRKLTNKQDSKVATNVILFPGLEGVATSMNSLVENLKGQVFGIQFCNNQQGTTIEQMAVNVLPHVERVLQKNQPFAIVGYSFGSVVALHVVHLLEQKGYRGTYICIDGAPAMLQGLTGILDAESDDKFQTTLVVQIMAITKQVEEFSKCNSLEERIALGQRVVGPIPNFSPEYHKNCIVSVYKRLKALTAYRPSFKIRSKVKLFKPKYRTIELAEEDHRLSDICDDVEVAVVGGDHNTILESTEMTDAINAHFSCGFQNADA